MRRLRPPWPVGTHPTTTELDRDTPPTPVRRDGLRRECDVAARALLPGDFGPARSAPARADRWRVDSLSRGCRGGPHPGCDVARPAHLPAVPEPAHSDPIPTSRWRVGWPTRGCRDCPHPGCGGAGSGCPRRVCELADTRSASTESAPSCWPI